VSVDSGHHLTSKHCSLIMFMFVFMIAEILVGSTLYTRGVDIWAVGTILGEMINGRPVFPGTSTMNQIERIIEVISMPSKQDIDAVGSPYASTMLGNNYLFLHAV